MITVKQYYHTQYGSLLAIQWPGFAALAAEGYKGPQFKGIEPYDNRDNGTLDCPKTGAKFVTSPGCWIARKQDASALVMNDKVFQRDCVEAENGHIELEEPCTIDLQASDPSKPIEVVEQEAVEEMLADTVAPDKSGLDEIIDDEFVDEVLLLVGSPNFDATLKIGEGLLIPLGDLVAGAHSESGLTAEQWNSLSDTARDALLNAHLSEWRSGGEGNDVAIEPGSETDPNAGSPDRGEGAEGDSEADPKETGEGSGSEDKPTEETSSPGGDSPASDEPAKQPS